MERSYDLARGLAIEYVADQVQGKTRSVMTVGFLILLAAAAAAYFTDGSLRLLAAFTVAAAAVQIVFTFVTGWAVRRLIRRFIPEGKAGAHARVVEAMDEIDFPTGPISGVRQVWRLRNGANAEIKRIDDVLREVEADLA